MIKENRLRLIVRQEIIRLNEKNSFLLEGFSNLFNSKLSYKDKLLFGSIPAAASFPGKNDNEIVLKLPESSDQSFTIDRAISMGGRFLTDDYFNQGSPFESALRSSVDSPEALSRNIAIAKIKNKSELDKSRSFNRSKHFFIVVDSSNKYLKDADLVAKQQDDDANPSLLKLLRADPLGGYGKFIDQLPRGERDKFVSALVRLNAALGVLSGGAAITAAVSSGAAAPIVAGMSGAASVGPSLALSSIAYNKGDKLEAAIYLICAVINTWASGHQVAEGVAAWNEARSILSVKGFFGSKVMPKIQNLKDLKALYSKLTPDNWLKLKDTLIKSGVGSNEKIILSLESLHKASPSLYTELETLCANLKEVISSSFSLSADAVGTLIDAQTVLEPTEEIKNEIKVEPELESSPKQQARFFKIINGINTKFLSVTGKSITSNKPAPGQSLVIDYETGKMKSINKIVIGSITDLRALTNDKIQIKNFSTENCIIAVPEYIFDTFDQLQRFPNSFSSTFSGNREKFFKDGNIIYMLDI